MSLPEIKSLIVAHAAYYGQSLDDHVVALYAQDLIDLGASSVAWALKELRRDPKQTKFPLPALIRERIKPIYLESEDAAEVATRIISGVSRFGWNNPERAKEFIGQIGWMIVERQGGWQSVCETLCVDNLPTLQAQWKNLAVSLIRRNQAGTLDQAPALNDLHKLNLPPEINAGLETFYERSRELKK